jgi:hypothetical protein
MDYYPTEASEASKLCSDHVPLPFAINTTQALGLKEIHLSDRFLIPYREGYALLCFPFLVWAPHVLTPHCARWWMFRPF